MQLGSSGTDWDAYISMFSYIVRIGDRKNLRSLRELRHMRTRLKQGEVSQDTQNLDKAIVHYLQKENAGKENADEMFCKSLVPILSTLPPQKNRRAKIETQKLLYGIECNEE